MLDDCCFLRTISLMVVHSQKIHIKHLFVYKYHKRIKHLDLAILTDSNQYIEYEIDFRSNKLSKWTLRRIRSIFEPYYLDIRSDVMVNKLLDENQAFYQYLMILKQHIGFKLQHVDLKRVLNRIFYFFEKFKAKKPQFAIVWRRIIDSRRCSWITQQIEYQIQNKGPTDADRIRTVRITMFYMVVKSYLYSKTKKSIEGRKRREQQQ